MNLQKIYDSLIKKYKNLDLKKDNGIYLECHHIKPKSMFPELEKDKDNLVNLTLKAHFVAHHLLWRIYRNKPMSHAFWILKLKDKNMLIKECVKLREDMIKYNTGKNNPRYGVHLSDETKRKISEGNKGKTGMQKENHPMWGRPVSEETRKKLSEGGKGKKRSKEFCENLSKRRKGKCIFPKGTKFTQSHKDNISKGLMGIKHEIVECPHCGKVGNKPNLTRWHFDNCKLKD